MRLLVFFALLSLSATALAQVPISPIPFESEVAAVKYVASDGIICSANIQECGGVIYKKGDYFYVTPPLTSHKPFNVDISFFWLPENQMRDYKIVADWHVHICSIHNQPFANYFSSSDIDANDGLHINGYMISNCDGNIRMYRPALDVRDDEEVDIHNTKTGKQRSFYLTIGHYVGWIDRNNLPLLHRYTGLDPQGHLEGVYKDDVCPIGIFAAPGGNLVECW